MIVGRTVSPWDRDEGRCLYILSNSKSRHNQALSIQFSWYQTSYKEYDFLPASSIRLACGEVSPSTSNRMNGSAPVSKPTLDLMK